MTRMSLRLRNRLTAFQRQHPEMNVHKDPFGMWHAEVAIEDSRYDEIARFLHSKDLNGLLDELETILAGGERADSG